MSRSAPTLPSATTSDESSFTLSDSDWAAIEKAFGHLLSADARNLIYQATANFVLFEPFERNASPRSEAKERIRSIQNAAKALFLTLHPVPPTSATVQADHLVDQHLRGQQQTPEHSLQHLSASLHSLAEACTAAYAGLDDPNQAGHREGECWDRWIRELTGILKSRGLPVTASTGSDKSSDGAKSAFVVLIEELQTHLPEWTTIATKLGTTARRHHHSTNALAKAIQRARRI
jgi:hypothetical protein